MHIEFDHDQFDAAKVIACDKYRPNYPGTLFDRFAERADLPPRSIVADIGAGTGALSELFLDRGHKVFAVEPYDKMRDVAARKFGNREGFTMVPHRAEKTGLADASVSVIAAGRALHWLDLERCVPEFRRISAARTLYCVFGTERTRTGSPLAEALEERIDQFRERRFLPTVSAHQQYQQLFGSDWETESVDAARSYGRREFVGYCQSLTGTPVDRSGGAEFEAVCHDLFDEFSADDELRVAYTAHAAWRWMAKP